MIRLSICETSDLVFPYNLYGNTGRIHSLFAHSFNIVVNDHLLHVSGQADFLSSFGIRLAPSDFQLLKNLQINDLVVFKRDKMVIYNSSTTFILSGKEQPIVSMNYFRLDNLSDEHEELLVRLESQNLLETIGIQESSEFQKVQSIMQAGDFSPNHQEKIFSFLIGRGLGLTPSGDDILLGYFWGLSIFSDLPIKRVLENNLSNLEGKTTLVSSQYLYAFLKERVSYPIFHLNKSLERRNKKDIEEAIKGIKVIGHTSGSDFLFGLLLSLKCVHKMKMRGKLNET